MMDSSEGQLPIVLEKTNSIEINIKENQNESLFQQLSKTLKEIEELINLIPSNKENEPIVESLKQKINLSQTQLLELKKPSKEEVVQNNNHQNIDNKMNLMLNKIDILIDMMNSNHSQNENTEEVIEKIYDNGDKYIGQLKNGKKNGKGKMFYADKSYYDGEWNNDLKNGQGHQTLSNGDAYDGTFKNNLMEGYGNYTYKNGRTYEGQFANNLMEGKGRYKFTTGNEYIGDFQKGLFNGKGTFLYSNGDRYEGLYKNGKKNGAGIYYFKSGEVYKGEWVKDERHGEGILIHKGGKEEVQLFENGKQKNIKNLKTKKK